MDNILDLLYEYSRRGLYIDNDFMSKVIKILIKENNLRGFVKRINFCSLSKDSTNHNEDDTPMAYSYYTRKILIDTDKVNIFRRIAKELTCDLNLSYFEQILLSNSLATHALLHEVEHPYQYKKSMIRNENFENLLLGVCCHIDNTFFMESKLAQLLMLKKGIYLNPQLYHNLRLQLQLERIFGASIPMERMANIHSTQEVNNMLAQISKIDCIDKVISFFDSLLASYQLNGYNFNDSIIPSPTKRYLEEVKKSNIVGMDIHFTESFDMAMSKAQNDSLEKRLLLGLDITEEEQQQMKMRLLRSK